jgi:hypothetical protein
VCGRGEKCGSSFLEKMKTMSLHGKNKWVQDCGMKGNGKKSPFVL